LRGKDVNFTEMKSFSLHLWLCWYGCRSAPGSVLQTMLAMQELRTMSLKTLSS